MPSAGITFALCV